MKQIALDNFELEIESISSILITLLIPSNDKCFTIGCMTWAEAYMVLENVTASPEYVYILYVHFIILDGAPNETETSEIVSLMTKFIKARPVKRVFL